MRTKHNYNYEVTSITPTGIVAMARAVPADKLLPESRRCNPGSDWVPRTREAVMKRTLHGAPDMVAAAQKLADTFAQPIGHAQPEWLTAVAGQRPCVPAVIAGQPDSMWRLSRTAPGPVRMYVSLSVSCGVTPKEAEARGAAILAAILQLQAMGRSVEVVPFFHTALRGETGMAFMKIPIPGPVSVAHLAATIGAADFMRALVLEVHLQRFPRVGKSFPFPEGYGNSLRSTSDVLSRVDSDPFCGALAAALDLQPDDVYVPGLRGTSFDGHKWVADVMAAHQPADGVGA